MECILQRGHVFNAMDTTNIRDIHKRFGTKPMDKLKLISSYEKYINTKLGRVVQLRPLNYIDYNRDRAFAELRDFCGFQYYGRKHLENILTAFVQLYWFPRKFGVDKRNSHLSSMIVSGQMTREEALRELREPLYEEGQMREYIAVIKQRLGLSDATFEKLMDAEPHEHEEYRCEKVAPFLHKILS